ncbi:MAG TPA: phosphatase PAP2 family protein [Thermoanaerobaculia bacterium]|jgi:membrane-associated phospholipid phosphatase|nr:phosphatase PAP2 family protein [Thermoanaerobaculia bacterium]
MSTDAKRRIAAIAFVALLLLSVWWPSPLVSINRLCCNADLAVDELSFLGREAPSWDIAFWCLAGLFLIALLQSGEGRDFREPWQQLRASRFSHVRAAAVALMIGAALVAIIWIFADAAVTAWAERIQSDTIEDAIRIANRLGGGMNPALLVFFFLIAGVVYRHRRWTSYAMAMALAGLGAGLLAQIVKALVGRTRPELWLGPFHRAGPSATSFPSGHTVGAFALAGVLVFASPSRTLRIVALLLAAAVGLSRILAFRHWTSDVVASAVLGLVVARLVTPVTKPVPALD